MKSRRVVVTIEMETDVPLAELKNDYQLWEPGAFGNHATIHQVQVNVIRAKKKAKK